MYWRHFNLSAEPFSLTPDPAFLYLSTVHAEAYAALMVGLRERRGLIAMIGEVGTGKTTLIYSLLSQLGPEIHTAYISNARLSFDGILRSALRDFGIECESVHSSELLETFNRFLHQCAEEGSTAALVIDEAQNLSRDTFEDLRLLTNFETYKHKLLQIVLVGQPELDSKLRDPGLRQVADRIAVRCHVNPLTPIEVRQYVQHRLSAAGGTIDIFSESALRLLVSYSRGIPRSINILGHNAMLFAYGGGRNGVTRGDVKSAVQEREGRGLIRFEARLPRFRRREGNTSRREWSYPQLLIAGVAAGLVLFALGASGAKFLAAERASRATPPQVEQSVAPQLENSTHARPKSDRLDAEAKDAVRKPEALRTDHGDRDGTAAAPAIEPAAPQDVPAEAENPASAEVLERPRTNGTRPAPHSAATPEENPDADATAKQPATEPRAEAKREAPAVAGAGVETRREASAPAETRSATAQPIAASAPAPETHAAVASAEPEAVEPPVLAVAPVAGPAQVAVPSAAISTEPASRVVGETRVGPDLVRVIQVSRGSSLYELMTDIYGSYDPRYVPRIQAMNPQVKDPNYIVAGDQLRFPEELGDQVRSGR